MDMNKTPYSEVCSILGELWMDYKDDEAFADFIAYNDLGLPLAYVVSEGIVSSTPLAEQYIMESWNILLDSLEVEDTGYADLNELLDAAQEE